MAEAVVARSQGVNWRRSPYETAHDIDLFDMALEQDTAKICWQFLHYDVNPTIADIRSYYWEMFDDKEHPLLSAFYKAYKNQNPTSLEPTYETRGRQPGKSQKISDKHEVDFKDFVSTNTKKAVPIARSAPY